MNLRTFADNGAALVGYIGRMSTSSQLIGSVSFLPWVCLKAVLLFMVAVIAFRMAPRRTLAEMAPFDFVAAIAVGAIVGRVPNSSNTGFVAGAVTLITILIAHNIVSRMRLFSRVKNIVDHPPRLLVVDGEVRDRDIKACGLTHEDLIALLRSHGVHALHDVRYAIFENRGSLSVVTKPDRLEADMMRGVPRAGNNMPVTM